MNIANPQHCWQLVFQGAWPTAVAFLGSSRLEEPLNRFSVTAAFHGHAHHGAPEGKTKGGVPVYNVAMKLLEHTFPGQLPYRILNLPRVPAGDP